MLELFFPNGNCHTWLCRAYLSRQKWSFAWTGNYFTGGMKSTQSVESANACIKRYFIRIKIQFIISCFIECLLSFCMFYWSKNTIK